MGRLFFLKDVDLHSIKSVHTDRAKETNDIKIDLFMNLRKTPGTVYQTWDKN